MSGKEWLVGVGVIALLVVLLVAAYRQEKAWQEFADDHCRVVGQMSGNMAVGIGTDGNMTTISTPGKTGYACDDGVTYWR